MAGDDPLEVKPLIGLVGILIAALTVEFNDQVSAASLVDIRGGLGISSDPGTWLTSLYATGQVIGMALATWWAVTVSIRRFALFAIALCCAATVACPFASNLSLFFLFRFLQGLAAGFTIPLLLTVGLRALPPPVRLYGLAAYALTASFAPNFAETLAALWTDAVNWRFVFFQDIPLCAVAGVLVWYGVPQDEPQYQRFRMFDWRGALLVVVLAFSLVTLLEQGDRLDWFNSKTICVLTLVSGVALPMLVVNEVFHPLPLFKFSLLARRNLAYALITLFAFIVLSQAIGEIPATYLQQVQGFRPSQIYPVTLGIAALQIIMLPMLAIVLNIAWVDARWVSFAGLVCVVSACAGDSFITSFWFNDSLFFWQLLIGIGEPMVVMPLLLISTNTVKPDEGPFASTLINTPRAIAEPVGVWLIQLIQRWRGSFHSDHLIDQIGAQRYRVIQAQGLIPGNLPPLLPNGQGRTPDSLQAFSAAVQAQVTVLTISDTFLILAMIAVGLIAVLAVLPKRTYPPRIALASQQ